MSGSPLPPPPSPFRVVSWNACYVSNKLSEVQQFLDKDHPSILIIQEAHLPPDYQLPTFYPYIHEYIPYTTHHNAHHNGMLFYIHPSVTYKFNNDPALPNRPSPKSLTFIKWLQVSSPMLLSPMIVGATYIDPGTFNQNDKDFVTGVINAISTEDLPVLWIGDFNARHQQWSNGTPNTQGRCIQSFITDPLRLLDMRLHLLNTRFSHVADVTRPSYDTTVDLALVSDIRHVSAFDVLHDTWLLSDHLPICVTMTRPAAPVIPSHPPHQVWSIKDADWSVFTSLLLNPMTEWIRKHTPLLYSTPASAPNVTMQTINDLYSSFQSIVLDAASTAVGKHTVSNTSKAWYTAHPTLPTLHSEFRRLYQLLKRHRLSNSITPSLVQQYNSAKQEYRSAVLEAKTKCWQAVTEKLDDRHKIVWSQWKKTIPSNLPPLASFQSPSSPSSLPSTPQQSLDNLAQHFANVSRIPNDPSFDTDHEQRVCAFLQAQPPFSPPHSVKLPFTLQNLIDECDKADTHTAMGPDDISPSFIKNGGNIMYKGMYLLFGILYNHGKLPAMFVDGNVVAIYKQVGAKSDGGNYRPICITSIVMRVFEHLMLPSLMDAMKRKGIPSGNQYGFTHHRSTYDAIYTFLSDVSQYTPFSYVPAVFVDISKAYDRVWIKGLLFKLIKMGVRDHLFQFYKALVSNRTFRVLHSNMKSSLLTLADGVPQGCVSSPCLFTIYMHDVEHHIGLHNNINLYADDILVWPQMYGHVGVEVLREALDGLSNYAARWKMKFSATKTQYVTFTNASINLPDADDFETPLRLDTFDIPRATEYRYLGVVLHQTFSCQPHINHILQSAFLTSRHITRLISFNKPPSYPIINRLVQSVLIPKITYGLPFVTLSPQQQLKLKRSILTPLCRSLGLPYTTHHLSLFIESRILPLQYIHAHSSLLFTHRLLDLASKPDNDNVAATNFHTHFHLPVNLPYPHPLRTIRQHMSIIPALSTPASLLLHPRHDLRKIIFNHFYREWYNSPDRHSLHPYYPSNIPPFLTLPKHLLVDSPSVAVCRSRLRFGRAHLGFLQVRIGYKNVSPNCASCNVPETVEHFLCDCPVYSVFRYNVSVPLSQLVLDLSPCMILSYPTHPVPASQRKYIHSIMSTFLTTLRSIRNF
jgi:hypothetical protein